MHATGADAGAGKGRDTNRLSCKWLGRPEFGETQILLLVAAFLKRQKSTLLVVSQYLFCHFGLFRWLQSLKSCLKGY